MIGKRAKFDHHDHDGRPKVSRVDEADPLLDALQKRGHKHASVPKPPSPPPRPMPPPQPEPPRPAARSEHE